MDDTAQTPSNSYVNTYVPPSDVAGSPVSPTGAVPVTPEPSTVPVDPTSSQPSTVPEVSPATNQPDESLEAQNIFELLGVNQATDQEKEAFLDELQQVIWEDFIENDVQLLITEAEMTEMQKLQTQQYPSDLEKQEALVVYLEKLIPDLENLMLDKALDLKRDMVTERVAGMKEYFATQPEKLQQIAKAEELLAQNQWRSAATLLNQLA